MKNLILIVSLFSVSAFAADPSPTPTAAHPSYLSPECKTWKKSHEEQRKKPSDTNAEIALLKEYPGTPGIAYVGNSAGIKPIDELVAVWVHPDCAIISVFDLAKVLMAEKLTSMQQKQFRATMIDLVKKESERKGFEIDLIIYSRVFETMTTLPWFKLSDAAFFEFSRISDETRKLQIELLGSRSYICQNPDKPCSEAEAKAELQKISLHQRSVERIYQSFVRWADRIQRSKP